MKNIEKKTGVDFQRENAYAGEVLRIFNLLKEKMSEEQATQLVYEIEKASKENDEVVRAILDNSQVIEKYDVKAYDGLELKPKPPATLPLHFIRDGFWKIKNLDESNLLTGTFFKRDGTYNSDSFLAWFNEDMKFNKLRLEQVEETGDLMITDPTKVRIRKIDLGGEKEEEKETIH